MNKHILFILQIFFFNLIYIVDACAWNETNGEKEESLSLTGNIAKGREIYELCATCHLPEGWGMSDGSYPQISGQHRVVLIKQLADIRQLNRDNPIMYPFAIPEEIGGAQAIADVAAYIETLPMLRENGVGSGKDLELGKKLYIKYCTECHGRNGEGDKDRFYPKIHGQHYNYLIRQFKWMQFGQRRNANPEMLEQIDLFSVKDTRALLDYVSRLNPPEDKTVDKTWRNPDFK